MYVLYMYVCIFVCMYIMYAYVHVRMCIIYICERTYVHTYIIMYKRLNQCDMVALWLRRLLSTGGSWVRLPLWPPCRDLGQVLYLQLPVRFGVKLRYSIRAVVGSAS